MKRKSITLKQHDRSIEAKINTAIQEEELSGGSKRNYSVDIAASKKFFQLLASARREADKR